MILHWSVVCVLFLSEIHVLLTYLLTDEKLYKICFSFDYCNRHTSYKHNYKKGHCFIWVNWVAFFKLSIPISSNFIQFQEKRKEKKFSIFCNTSVRHERHKCVMSDTSATQVLHEQRECYTNGTGTILVKILILTMTHVKKYFRTPMLAIWEMKGYNREEQFHSKKYLFGNVSFLC